MSDVFGSVPVSKKGRTLFNESHSVCGSFPLTSLVPVFATETIPGDRWDINVFNLTKLETLLAPAMQKIDASLLWFKIPKRLLFKHFKKWYSGGEDGQDSHEKPHFFIWQFAADVVAWGTSLSWTSNKFQSFTDLYFGAGSLWQYLGLPVPLKYDSATGVWSVRSILEWKPTDLSDLKTEDGFIDLIPILGYHMLYDQYFRDQTLDSGCYEDSEEGILKINASYNNKIVWDASNIQLLPSTTGYDLSEGGEIDWKDVIRLLLPFTRAWKKDYFTSAMPNAQRGPEVTLTIAGEAPVTISDDHSSLSSPGIVDYQKTAVEGSLEAVSLSQHLAALGVDYGDDEVGTVDEIRGRLNATGTADLTGLSPITITAFRNLFKLQAFLEKNNVAGGRFIETILAHWAERVPDFTVQRAQHIRSTSIPVQISEVYATANSTGVNSQVGDQGGIGKTRGNLGKVHIYTQEPCVIFALYNVTCPPSYANQGIHRMWQRRTRFDEPWRDFQHIGEQAIKNRELYFDFVANDDSYNNEDFGYQQRFSEFKYMPDRIVGDFQTSLSYWHMARMFSGQVYLNKDFVTQNLDERIFAVQNVRPVIADFFFDAVAKRKLSKFSTPKLT